MPGPRFGIFSIIAVAAALGVGGMMLRQSYVQRTQDLQLQHEMAESRLARENQRLSNMVMQASLSHSGVFDQLQELPRIRAELSRLRLEKNASNEVMQAQLAASLTNQLRELASMREEMSALAEEISSLRAAMEESYQASPAPAAQGNAVERPAATTTPGSAPEDRTLALRMIETQGDAFALKLKSSTSAAEGETFPEVFGRFLRANGVDVSQVGAMAYDERTGRVIVRAPRATLDVIERLTVGLDRGP